MNPETRLETDSMGQIAVPKDACYGAQTARALENFPISGWRFPRSFIRALGLIKKHAALVNGELDRLRHDLAEAIAKAAQEVVEGTWDDQFVVDIFQTGSGTSTNMNANEVIAHRASVARGFPPEEKIIHPNDHVNMGQSSNDVMPTALHMAALECFVSRMKPALVDLSDALSQKALQFHDVFKVGRTHLQDALPMRLGQEFSGYASQVEKGLERLDQAARDLGEVPLGGTAIGTGLNTHPDFASRVIQRLASETGLPLRRAGNAFEAQAARDACVMTSAALKTLAVSLWKIANDLRHLASGPRCGIGEIRLPEVQPGSSIMPGKINPVMCEMLMQVCAQVIGNDATITWGGAGGNYELNTMLPLISHNLLQSMSILDQACRAFASHCVKDLQADPEQCQKYVEQSLAQVTALVPEIGYDQAAAIAKKAHQSGISIREAAAEMSDLDPETLDRLLTPRA